MSVANSVCVVCISQKNEIPARPMICHSCQLASYQLTRYVSWIVRFVWLTNLLKCVKDHSDLCVENVEKEWQSLVMFSKYSSNYNEVHPLGSCSWEFSNQCITVNVHLMCLIAWLSDCWNDWGDVMIWVELELSLEHGQRLQRRDG